MPYTAGLLTEASANAAASSAFRWLPTNDESFRRMLEGIRRARHSVSLEMYIFTQSAIGEAFREALLDASWRGLQVRVLIDAWGSMGLNDDFWAPLRQAGGQCRWFNPLEMRSCGFRDHRKLLVCDGGTAFVGGFNIAAEYEGDGVTRGWRDFGLEIRGPLARELERTFDLLYALTEQPPPRLTRWKRSAYRDILSVADGQILLGGPGRGRNYFKGALIADVAQARSIRIICAYFIPARPLRRMLIRRARRGVKVQLIMPGKSDVPLARLAARRFYGGFLRAGVEIYEYQPQILHAKLFLFDDVVYAGSANLDRRSFYINYELMLRLPNPALAREASQFFERDLKFCRKIDARSWRVSRSSWSKLKEWFALWLLTRIDSSVARWQLQYFLKPKALRRIAARSGSRRRKGRGK